MLQNKLAIKPLFFWFTLILGFIAINANAANISASVDRNTLGLDETLTLTISAQGQVSDEPNLSELKNDFDILGKSSSRSINVVNGNYQARTDWQIELAPKRSGKLLIPSFRLDKSVSDAIPIEVSQTATQTATDKNSPIQLTIEVSKQQVLVQEQIFVKVKLTTQVGLNNIEPQSLQIPNARVIAYDTRQFHTSYQGRNQIVVETDYAIFPQEVGELVIPSLTYSVEQDTSRDFFSNPWGRSRNPVMRLRTEEQRVKVLPAEQNLSSTEWMPADAFKMTETWSGNFDHLKVGDAITRTITLEAEGLAAAQISPLNIANVDGLTFYPDQPRMEDNKSPTGIIGKRIESLAIVATHAGTYHLPAMEVRWWNLKTHEFEIARLPAKSFEVEADPNAPVKTQNTPNIPAETLPTSPTSTNAQSESTKVYFIWQIACAALALMIAGLIIYIVNLKAQIKKLSTNENLAPETNKSNETDQSVWHALKQSANQQDALGLRKAIIHWANQQWPDDNIGSLDEVATRINQTDFTIAMRALDASLYSDEKNISINSALILKCLNQYQKNPKAKDNKTQLKSLYPQ